ncbi:MAG: hypothetical protein A2087_06240 [Spirochaetes bacterium GWD1_61_31]|nr:MAG: hypothetical protein A2Y37_01125 [Spirochaetes bacterium GWB1_60_80]OHD35214.1 MAG: hypothetical protein A2004_11280 [Spirochaetes bacterium GWC1_61_12]OHD41790.1 MAG: hypothetical protein A2087_06240 [Spirochaetes bacterium GWD1_61_31]OHD42595.1 MAG: hypothetical protein A2Y35_07760 [Spirochaetes bacterium GWE1_60_18]OHD59825.1 MAG: hypothetical protein A2Y32_01525 [Spirochaetes bacterium GWF1_60_12]HAP44158.1 rRNA large subunit methyltransferase I [Spirochaetaceae bacterium]
MKQAAYIILKPGADKRLKGGHPWIFDNEISHCVGLPTAEETGLHAGQRVQLFSTAKQFLGSGLASPASKIRVRRYSAQDEAFSAALIQERLETAWRLRKARYQLELDSCRLVFGEADGLPGLIVDLYTGRSATVPTSGVRQSWLVVQLLFAGLEPYRQHILDSLESICQPSGIYERSEAAVRQLEGLPPASGPLRGQTPDEIIIRENELDFGVHLTSGQKTGWFLDQARNRAAVAAWAVGQSVLDVCCNAGGFSLCAARAGAKSVLAVDASADALTAVQANATRNQLADRVRTLQADAFEALRTQQASGERYGLIIVDPPAFAKNHAALAGARRGYRDLNLQAIKLLAPGGVLASFSCSHWLGRDLLQEAIEEAAVGAGRRLRYLEELQQAPDHPMMSGYPESRYLKGFVVQAVE